MVKEEVIKELYLTRQMLENYLLQKRMIEAEVAEIDAAINELKNTQEDKVYKIVGSIALLKNKEKVLAELEERKKLLETKKGMVEKYIEKLNSRIKELQEEIKKGGGE